MELLDYVAGIGVEMSCHPFCNELGVIDRWQAEIENVWSGNSRNDCFPKASWVRGATAEEALANYAKEIAGGVLAVGHEGEYFAVPASLTHTPGYRFGPGRKDKPK